MCFFYTPSHMHAFLCCGSSRNWGTYISKCLFTKMVGSRVDLWGCEISVWWQPRRWVVFLHWLKFPSLFMVCKNPIGTCSRAQSDLPYWKHSLLVCSWPGRVLQDPVPEPRETYHIESTHSWYAQRPASKAAATLHPVLPRGGAKNLL